MQMLNDVKRVAQFSWAMFRYNMKIIFGGKFIYFFLAGMVAYLLGVGGDIYWGKPTDLSDVFHYLMFPAVLLVFYPSAFGVQNDMDQRTVEILFTIPNYRFKVWLVRLFIANVLVFLIIYLLAYLTQFLLMGVPYFELSMQLMIPVFFLSTFAFMVSTRTRSGLGTAIIVVIVAFAFFVVYQNSPKTPYQIFFNPYRVIKDMHQLVWENAKFNNRLYLLVGSFMCLLYGLMNLQKREKFKI
ncbi:MAG: hypothetical protein MI784_04570 [Cytophagales bacterium]|nr:hypothetical protein [Cytophagales bacterium]